MCTLYGMWECMVTECESNGYFFIRTGLFSLFIFFVKIADHLCWPLFCSLRLVVALSNIHFCMLYMFKNVGHLLWPVFIFPSFLIQIFVTLDCVLGVNKVFFMDNLIELNQEYSWYITRHQTPYRHFFLTLIAYIHVYTDIHTCSNCILYFDLKLKALSNQDSYTVSSQTKWFQCLQVFEIW